MLGFFFGVDLFGKRTYFNFFNFIRFKLFNPFSIDKKNMEVEKQPKREIRPAQHQNGIVLLLTYCAPNRRGRLAEPLLDP